VRTAVRDKIMAAIAASTGTDRHRPAPTAESFAHGPALTAMQARLVLSILIGVLAGFGFYRFVGCRSGACPIRASPVASTRYGALLGFVVLNGS